MLTPNSIPERPSAAARAAACGRRAPPPQIRRSVLCSIFANSPSSLITSPRTPASATSRFDPEPTTPTSEVRLGGPGEQALELLGRLPARQRTRPPRRCGSSSGARAGSRAPLPRAGRAAHSRRPRDRPRAGSASRSTSPAPSVTTTSPSASRLASTRCGLVERRQPPDRAPAGVVRAGVRDELAGDARQLALGPLARRVDVEHDDDVGAAPARGRAPGAGAACASRGAAGRRRSAASGRARAPPAASPRPRSGDGRSRRTCARRCALPAPRSAGRPGGRSASDARRPLEVAARGRGGAPSAASAFRTLCRPAPAAARGATSGRRARARTALPGPTAPRRRGATARRRSPRCRMRTVPAPAAQGAAELRPTRSPFPSSRNQRPGTARTPAPARPATRRWCGGRARRS